MQKQVDKSKGRNLSIPKSKCHRKGFYPLQLVCVPLVFILTS